jgi:four helix bundle protein
MENLNINLVEEAKDLRSTVLDISEKLPREKVSNLKHRLDNCLNNLPNHIQNGLATDKKIERIRSFVRANGDLNECQDYITALSHLQYIKKDDDAVIDKIDDLRQKINSPDIIRQKAIN